MSEAQVRRGLRVAMCGMAFSFLVIIAVAAGSYDNGSVVQSPQAFGNQNPAQAVNPADPPAEEVFKNIQTLKGMPASQLKAVMTLISTSVGMKCEQCHVPDAFEKDDKRSKQTSRGMIQLVMNVNKTSFEGQPQITCFSCHRGQQRPVAMPPIAQLGAPIPTPAPRPAATDLPTYDQIIDKYLGAVGSSAAYEKLKSRVMKGAMIDGKGGSFPVEVYQAAPNKMVVITTLPNGTASQGYNGSIGWATGPNGQSELKGLELAKIKRAADIARFLKIREESLSPRVVGKVKVGEKEAYQIAARADGQRVQLFFDTQTSLLLRRLIMSTTVLGVFPEQTDYDDYREVDGVKLPFVTRYSTPDPAAASTMELKEIAHNVTVDDSKFNPPQIQEQENRERDK
jgi:photosynthetic reaction center cytochrome c subunit